MAIEIKLGSISLENKQLCAGCFTFANSPSVVAGGPVMVSPKSETAKRTGLGKSEAFGTVCVPFSQSVAYTDSRGRVHLQVPITQITMDVSGEEKISKVYFASVAHDLKALP